jgi:hypothetical protein
MQQRQFSWRKFAALLLAWTFLALIVSGTILFIAPPGRIANWTQWRIVALTKAQWQSIHILNAILFVVACFFPLISFNWKAFATYMKKGDDQTGIRIPREFVLSICLFTIVFAATIASLPPFNSVISAGESIKESWDEPDKSPPTPHLEEERMSEIAGRLKVQPSAVSDLLAKNGMKVPSDTNAKLKDVARQNRMSPQAVYEALQPKGNNPYAAQHQLGSGGGLGDRAVAIVAKELGMTPQEAVAALASHNLTATPDESLREVAFRQGKRPFEILNILQQSAESKKNNKAKAR